jgi:hypothetical protein
MRFFNAVLYQVLVVKKLYPFLFLCRHTYTKRGYDCFFLKENYHKKAGLNELIDIRRGELNEPVLDIFSDEVPLFPLIICPTEVDRRRCHC